MNFNKYKECSKLLFEIYPSDKIEGYKTKYKQDPFFKLGKNSMGRLDDLNAWYKEKNPNFEPFSEHNNPEMPEFKHLIAGMIKDFYFLLNDENIKKNNTDKLNIILAKIEAILENGYKYISIIDVIYEYLIFFEIILNQLIYNKEQCNLLLNIKNTPYIIYPTFHQLDFIKINLTMGTPFLNFLLTNKKHLSHGSMSRPCWELTHDIDIHYNNIMIQFFKELNTILNNNNEYISFINENIELFKLYFEFMNNFIINIKDLLIYDRSKKNISNRNEKGNIIKSYEINIYNKRHNGYKNLMNSVLIFYLFHEQYFFQYFFTLLKKKEIKKIFERQNSNKNKQIIDMIKDYFIDSFKLLCIYFLFTDEKSLKKNLYDNFQIKPEMIHPELIELLEIAFNSKITQSNIDTFIDLYKESVEVINNKVIEL